jgi:hypothetical protein
MAFTRVVYAALTVAAHIINVGAGLILKQTNINDFRVMIAAHGLEVLGIIYLMSQNDSQQSLNY